MLQLLLAAPSSGSGKTTAACALLSALKARGLEPCAFKCGPDYIDPMFHRAVLGVPSHNLDLFFSTPQTVRRLYTSGAAGHGSVVCEGAMGYYDGLGGVSATASAWHTADVLDLPVLLVVRPKVAETTRLGAAYAAGIASGFWSGREELYNNWEEDKRWIPDMEETRRTALFAGWKKAVTRTFDWVE